MNDDQSSRFQSITPTVSKDMGHKDRAQFMRVRNLSELPTYMTLGKHLDQYLVCPKEPLTLTNRGGKKLAIPVHANILEK